MSAVETTSPDVVVTVYATHSKRILALWRNGLNTQEITDVLNERADHIKGQPRFLESDVYNLLARFNR